MDETQPPQTQPDQIYASEENPQDQPNKLAEIKKFLLEKYEWFKARPTFAALAVTAIIFLFAAIGVGAYFVSQRDPNNQVDQTQEETSDDSPEESPEPSPSPSDEERDEEDDVPLFVPSPTSETVPSPAALGPGMKITYPTNGQEVELPSRSWLCIEDSPTDFGNNDGLQMRHAFDSDSFSTYEPHGDLCFERPSEGQHTLKVQYRNSSGVESAVTSITFSLKYEEWPKFNLTGTIYEDKNCNASRDSGENPISVPADVTLWDEAGGRVLWPETSDSSGKFSFNFSFFPSPDSTVTVSVNVVSPSGYKSPPSYSPQVFSLNRQNNSANVEIPQVPVADIGNCSI